MKFLVRIGVAEPYLSHDGGLKPISIAHTAYARNIGECFISLLVEPIAGKNASLSDKQLWRFL